MDDSISVEERYLQTADSEAVFRVQIYKPKGLSQKLPAMLYLHGGGYITGSPEVFKGTIASTLSEDRAWLSRGHTELPSLSHTLLASTIVTRLFYG